MTDRIDKLDLLIEKIESGELNRWSVCGAPFTSPQKAFINYAYNGSLDAAKALHEAVLPKTAWFKLVGSNPNYAQVGIPGHTFSSGFGSSPARAWLLAILRALAASTAP